VIGCQDKVSKYKGSPNLQPPLKPIPHLSSAGLKKKLSFNLCAVAAFPESILPPWHVCVCPAPRRQCFCCHKDVLFPTKVTSGYFALSLPLQTSIRKPVDFICDLHGYQRHLGRCIMFTEFHSIVQSVASRTRCAYLFFLFLLISCRERQ